MNPTEKISPPLRRLALIQVCTLMLLSAPFIRAQMAAANAPDAATLAKYDTNKTGKLDPDEIAAMEADQKKAIPVEAKTAAAGDEPVVLSPFEVVSDTKGYYSANVMSGTRFNSKLDDLASSISVVTKE